MTIGIANLPNQKHRKVAKRGERFNLLIVGQSGLGKRTFINTLFAGSILKTGDDGRDKEQAKIRITEAVLTEKGFLLRLNIIEALGFGEGVDNSNSWQPIVEHIDSQYNAYLNHEMRSDRSNLEDGRVHAALYFIEPTGHSLKPLDIITMKELGNRVNLIPVIAKADTITPQEMAAFKQRLLADFEANGIHIFRPTADDDDKETVDRLREIVDAIPFAVIGSEQTYSVNNQEVRARKYHWGFAEVENDTHCDFKKLRSLLLRTHLLDLIVSTQEVHYERFRDQKLQEGGLSDGKTPEQLRRDLNAEFDRKTAALKKQYEEKQAQATEKIKANEAAFRAEEVKMYAEKEKLINEVNELKKAVNALLAAAPAPKKK